MPRGPHAREAAEPWPKCHPGPSVMAEPCSAWPRIGEGDPGPGANVRRQTPRIRAGAILSWDPGLRSAVPRPCEAWLRHDGRGDVSGELGDAWWRGRMAAAGIATATRRARATELDLLGPLVDQEHDEVALGVVGRDRVGDVLQQHRFSRAAVARRFIASAAGLPRVCVLKRCRRKKRYLGAGLVCVHHDEGLLRKRYASALARLGWEKQNLPRRSPGQVGKGREAIGAEARASALCGSRAAAGGVPRPVSAATGVSAATAPAPACLSPAPPERGPLREPLEAPLRGAPPWP